MINDIAPPKDLGWASYGIGWMSYLHSPGHGLWSQLFAVAASFFSLPVCYKAIVGSSASMKCGQLVTGAVLVAVALLANLFYGYMALASVCGLVVCPLLLIPCDRRSQRRQKCRVVQGRACRFFATVMIAGLMSAYFVCPFLVRAATFSA